MSIVDFSFSPATITIHTGDTITWTNTGKQPHTATARNGSFNTGILKHGQSASHTFSQAGTFTFYCTIHPFMHGTVVVVAASTTTTQTTPTTTTTPTPTTPSAAPSPAVQATPSNALPVTGLNVPAAVLAGLLLAGAGVALRRRTRSGTEPGR